MPQITVDELHALANKYFTETKEERVNSCSRMSQVVKLELEDEYNLSVTPYVVELSNSYGSETHRMLEVPASQIDGITTQEPVFLDPSIHQFCESNYEQGLVELYFDDSMLPSVDEIGIITASHPLHSHITRVTEL